jgi:hypothetical protein
MSEAEATEKPVLTFNDTNYVIEDLSERARYCVNQIQDLDVQITQTKARLDQIEVAKRGFTDILQSEVDGLNEEPVDAEVENG